MYADRLLPHDIEAEEAIIGSLLIDNDSLNRVTSFLKDTDFFSEKNRWCYAACLSLANRDQPINQVTVAHELSLEERLEAVGGVSYLAHLVMVVPTSVHVEHYAEIVHRMSVMRRLIRAGGDIASLAYEGGPDADEILGRAEDLLFAIRAGRGSRDFTHIRDILDTYMEESGALHEPGAVHLAPVPTGFPGMDELLGGGMQRTDMIVLAARPSLGKSALAFNIARHVAGEGYTVGIFSLEMGGRNIGMRLLSSEANVDSTLLRMGLLREDQERTVLDAIGQLSDLPIYVDDTPIQGIVEMRGKARRLQAEHNLDLLIVDYLQLISGGSGRNENRAQEMGEISRSLKGMARDLDVPVLACSQLSRAIEQRPTHRPMLSDLRESGSIEQDADVVAFIHREDKYVTREEWERRNPTRDYPQNVAEIIISKHRNGPLGVIPMYFREDFARFESAQGAAHSMEFA